MPKVTVMPSGTSFEIDEKTPLLDGLRRNGYYVKSTCGGKATCSDCVIKIQMGQDNLSSQEFPELRLMGNVFHITKERLSCQTKISGDVVVDISNHDQALARPYEIGSMLNKPADVKTVVRSPEDQQKVLDEREEFRKVRQEKFQQKKEQYGGMSRPKTFKENPFKQKSFGKFPNRGSGGNGHDSGKC